eukprot:NODE_2244_length_1238_cov_33.255626_g2133_i0.p1 GENE.NODE_2244_length_1238_cov_33.255626_g2133_i0~~NODE_2244_length_1238_cov_33.255626_g2133_i0.p1  ORF type:complete len:256 (+),score=34.49 NODE_2244_length_1238_cov_33.255626_g2133_i0:394-1161(+)
MSAYPLSLSTGAAILASGPPPLPSASLRTAINKAQRSCFGTCSFRGHTTLAKELLAAAHTWPPTPLPNQLRRFVKQYWKTTQASTKVAYSLRKAARVLNFGQCSEASSNTMWAGVKDDAQCRRSISKLTGSNHSAATLLKLRGLLNNKVEEWCRKVERALHVGQISCVAAMEAVGWMAAFLQTPGPSIPMVNIRGMSNYDHVPVKLQGGQWIEEPGWLSPAQDKEMVRLGYAQAIESTSALLLHLFDLRRQRESV